MAQEPYTPEDIRDLISQAISDSIDMDWQPGWGADAVVKALADAGLMVVPDVSKLCVEHGMTYASIDIHHATYGSWWAASFHRGPVVFRSEHSRDASPSEAVSSALTREGYNTQPAVEPLTAEAA